MYIKSIVLDGFKSYGQRTEISGFDNLFNAITGLNGSGKSNILDAICFLLGITNLAHVRVSNLQELVYKSGQAGINRATVSIIFDNKDKVQCPPGLEEYDEITVSRQVVIGGTNRYMLNGINVTNKRIQDLFCSVQLNVNNPNFLIMQGQVTKVLNMKSDEILAMIEESAGTRMYEIKKQQCQRSLNKKLEKHQEFNGICETEVLPNLDKLRKERSQYLEYQRIDRELNHMIGLYSIWRYCKSQKDLENAQKAHKKAKELIQSIEMKIKQNNALINEKKTQQEQLIKSKKSDINDKLQSLESQRAEKEKIEAKINANSISIENNIKSEERNMKQLEKNIVDDENKISGKKNALAKVQNMFETLRENEEKDNAAFDLAQKKFVAFSAGMEINDDGESETLQEQLMKANTEASEAETAFKQASDEMKFCQDKLKKKQKEVLNTSEYNRFKGDEKTLEKEVKQLQAKLSSIKYSEEKFSNLTDSKRTLHNEINMLAKKIDNFELQKPYTKFSYTDPEPNFNKNRIIGTVCRLIKCNDPSTCTALETAAGRKIYDVVVDTEKTGKLLLDKGNLQQRTTFIPLNKIQSHRMNDRTIKLAQDLVGKENCRPALSLITYDPVLQPAMEFIFGNVFICKDINVAKKVTYHKEICRRSVTLDGDVCDPGGTMSGGAAQKGNPVLLELSDVLKLEGELKLKKAQLHKIETELRNMMAQQEEYNAVTQSLNKKSHELNVIKQNVENTSYHQLQQEIADLKAHIEELTTKMNKCKQQAIECKNKSKELEEKIKRGKGNRESLLKEAEAELKRIQKKAEASKKAWIDQKQNYELLQLEIQELEKEMENSKQEVVKIVENINKLKEEYERSKEEKNSVLEEIKHLQSVIKETKAEIASQMNEVNQLEEERKNLTAENHELQLQLRQKEHDMKKVEDDLKLATHKERDATRNAKEEIKDNYMEKAKTLSNQEGLELEQNINSYQEKKTKLSRTINPKAQSMFQHEEKLFNDLSKKSKRIEEDIKRIKEVMADLDEKKKNSLKLAYEQISQGFGSIFSTLLPGANAKLVAPFGKTFLQGLEIKVSLGGIWKENLTELSGGQRSLAALSLILSMLSFKPAPIYILDEVDAALDLSHTQNIGVILKQHFKKSQFVIVSLKDGMFSNANVLFRTEFVDGVSKVSRTVNKND